jgi:hypothetical protein
MFETQHLMHKGSRVIIVDIKMKGGSSEIICSSSSVGAQENGKRG